MSFKKVVYLIFKIEGKYSMTTSNVFSGINQCYSEWFPTSSTSLAKVSHVGGDTFSIEGICYFINKSDEGNGRLIFRSQKLELDSSEALDSLEKVKAFVRDFMNGEFTFLEEGNDSFVTHTLQAILRLEGISSNKYKQFEQHEVSLAYYDADYRFLNYIVDKFNLPKRYMEILHHQIVQVRAQLKPA